MSDFHEPLPAISNTDLACRQRHPGVEVEGIGHRSPLATKHVPQNGGIERRIATLEILHGAPAESYQMGERMDYGIDRFQTDIVTMIRL